MGKWAGLMLLLSAMLVAGGSGDERFPKQTEDELAGRKGRSSVILVGDTQRTGFWERVLFREQNDSARQAVVDRIASEDPAFVVLLGDVVANGGDEEGWSYFETCSRPIRERQIPMFAVPGNHEYFGAGGERKFLQRFPHPGGHTWEAFRYDSIGFILLNSNFSDMGETGVDSQQVWYGRMLEQYQNDSTVSSVVVCCHHPPFTNSTIVSPSVEVQRAFVAPFLATPKARLFFSGHCHAYEHFGKGGKTFIVSGGGGGPRQRVETDPQRRRYTDLYRGPGLRPFHFCRLLIHGGSLRVQMIRLEPASGQWSVGDEVVVVD